MSGMTTPAELRDILGSMAGRRVISQEIADALGISRNAANDRMNRGLDAGDLITVARKLDINPVEVLVELRRLTRTEVFDFMDSDGTLLVTATPEQLRYQLAELSLTRDEKLRLAQDALGDDELAVRRSNNAGGVVHPLPYAADSSDTEPEEGDDDCPDGP